MDDSIINNRQVKSDQFPTLSDVLVTAISWAGDHSSIFYQFHHRPAMAHTFPALLTRHGRWQRRYYCFKSRPSRPECFGWLVFIFQTSCLRGEETSRGELLDLVTNKWGGRLLVSCRPPPPSLFHPRSRQNFSILTLWSVSASWGSAWEPDMMRISKQTISIVPVSALTGAAGHWSASHDTESDDKMGRDNGKLTRRERITPDLARSITWNIETLIQVGSP